MLKQELDSIIKNTSGERKAMDFLSKNPSIIRWAVCRTGGHSTYIVKEFTFGSNFRADFIVAMSYSGVWEIHLIELEPHNDMVITKGGVPSQRLNKAISQLADWKSFIDDNKPLFRKDLADWCMKKDLLGYFPVIHRPSNFCGDYLDDLRTSLNIKYHIIIGNRDKISSDNRRRMNQLSQMNDIEIFSYGRLLDIAGNLDKHNKYPDESVLLTDTEDRLY